MRKSAATLVLATALFLMVVGAKWATFDRFGSPMPDWDQWDAEALELFVPWFTNDNFLQHLVHPHNEHRVVLTKLQNLALVLINGQWDSRLESVTNAMLHAALAVAFWCTGRRWLATRWHAPLFLLTLALFGLPLAWQNVIGGFHSQQYWLLAMSFAAIVLVPFARAWSGRWWLGIVAAVLALGSMGSGFLAAAVVITVVGWRLWKRETTLGATWPTLIWMAALVAIGLLTRVEVDWHQKLKAKTAHDFFFSIIHSMQWPLRDQHWAAAVMWLPWVLVAATIVRTRTAPTGDATPSSRESGTLPAAAPAQIIVAFGGWVLVQILATAYARGAGADYPASRYMDTLVFGAMANGLAVGWGLSLPFCSTRTKLVRGAIALAWVVTLGLGLHEVTDRNLRHELPDAKKYYIKAEGHMRRYLATNEPKQLAHPEIPFPSADGLVERLAIPSLRQLMPLPIRAPLELSPATKGDSVFLENDARGEDPEHPPRRGVSPATSPLDAARSWGSFGADGLGSKGTWKSAPLSGTGFPWLKFEIAGDAGPPHNHDVSLALHDAASGELLSRIHPSRRPRDTWRAAYVPSPKRPFVVVASDQSIGGWLAFSPTEMGGASYWAWQAAKHGLMIFYGGLAMTLLVAGCAMRSWRRQPAGSSTSAAPRVQTH